MFYNHSISYEANKILNYYKAKGLVTVLTWNLPLRSWKRIKCEAESTSQNDCNLRLVNRYSFAVFVDVDEFIIPYFNWSLPDLFRNVRVGKPLRISNYLKIMLILYKLPS